MIALQKSAQNQLRQFIEQLERLEEEKRSIQVDIKEKFQEAKALGFDVKAMRRILQLRRKSKADREEEEAILQTYMHALGMLEDTPLGQWALEQKKDSGADSKKNGTDSNTKNEPFEEDGRWWKRDEHGALVEVAAP
jgi:Uncharacterized protein conserved in bacteria